MRTAVQNSVDNLDPLHMLIFLALLLVVRGLPALLVYRRALPPRQRVEITFITATTLPLLIALVDIGQQDGIMLPATAAALVGAGVLSVLLFPLIAVTLHRSAPLTPADAGITEAGITEAQTAIGANPAAGASGELSTLYRCPKVSLSSGAHRWIKPG